MAYTHSKILMMDRVLNLILRSRSSRLKRDWEIRKLKRVWDKKKEKESCRKLSSFKGMPHYPSTIENSSEGQISIPNQFFKLMPWELQPVAVVSKTPLRKRIINWTMEAVANKDPSLNNNRINSNSKLVWIWILQMIEKSIRILLVTYRWMLLNLTVRGLGLILSMNIV